MYFSVPDNQSTTSSSSTGLPSPSQSNSASSEKTRSVVRPALGGAIGGTFLLGLCIVFYLWYRRRNSAEPTSQTSTRCSVQSVPVVHPYTLYRSTTRSNLPPYQNPSSSQNIKQPQSVISAYSGAATMTSQELEKEMTRLREQMSRLETRQREIQMQQTVDVAPPGYVIE